MIVQIGDTHRSTIRQNRIYRWIFDCVLYHDITLRSKENMNEWNFRVYVVNPTFIESNGVRDSVRSYVRFTLHNAR